MRRTDREVPDFDKIMEIVDECDILRLGLSDGDYPYIVPVNFAYKLANDKLFFYIHGAKAGRKYNLLQQNPVCSFEMDIPIRMELIPEKKDVTMRYKSVMGKAKVTFLEGDEKQKAIDDIIMARYEETKAFEYNHSALSRTSVIQLEVTEITGKANLH